MLTSTELELLLLAIDGECSSAQEEQLRILLANSPEASRVYQQFLQQRDSLAALPRISAPQSLRPAILDRIVVVPARQRATRREQSWLPLVTAACLFVTVGIGAFFLTINSQPRLARHSSTTGKSAPFPAVNDKLNSPDEPAGSELAISEIAPRPHTVPSEPIPDTPMPSDQLAAETAPAPRLANPSLVASAPLLEQPKLTDIQLRLPWLVEPNQLVRPEGKTRLNQELSKSVAFRLDLHGRDVPAAVEAFLTAAKSVGLKPGIDAQAQERLHRKLPGSFAIYTEALSASDWSKLLLALAQLPAGSGKEPPVATYHLIPASMTDANDVRTLLGVDPGLFKRTPGNNPLNPLSQGTLSQVTNNLRGASSKAGVLVSYGPPGVRTLPAQSVAIRNYLEQRGDRHPNTIPMLIVIR